MAPSSTGDEDVILDALVHMGMVKDRDAFDPDALFEPTRRALQPLTGPQPFHYSRDQLEQVISEAMKLRVGVNELRLLRQLDCPPEYVLLGRTSLGMEAVLCHLEATVDFSFLKEELDGAAPLNY